jgi:hypothetical protein
MNLKQEQYQPSRDNLIDNIDVEDEDVVVLVLYSY